MGTFIFEQCFGTPAETIIEALIENGKKVKKNEYISVDLIPEDEMDYYPGEFVKKYTDANYKVYDVTVKVGDYAWAHLTNVAYKKSKKYGINVKYGINAE